MSNFAPAPNNRTSTNINLKDALDLVKKEIFLNLNCHALGTIQGFSSSDQTVMISINYQKTYLKADANGVYKNTFVDYPAILQCPMVIIQGGSASLTMPIAVGDSCLVLFNDRDIDTWLMSGQVGPVASQRLHSYTDAMVLVGLNAIVDPISDYDSIRAVLRAGSASGSIAAIGVNPNTSKVLITNSYPDNGTTLNSLLQNLITQLENMNTAIKALTVSIPISVPTTPYSGIATSGNPLNSSTFTTLNSNISAIATQLGGLLE